MDTRDRHVDVPYVSVEDEPMHHELWRTPTFRVLRALFPARSSCLWHEHTRCTVYICITAVDVIEHKYGQQPAPLQLEKGAVMCRDHSVTPLIHTASTKDQDVVMVGVEFQQRTLDGYETRPHRNISTSVFVAAPADTQCVYTDTRSRVDKFTLYSDTGTTTTGTNSESHETTVQLPAESVLVTLEPCELQVSLDDGGSRAQTHTMDAGAAISIQAGRVTLTLQASAVSTAKTFYLVQVFQ